MPLAGVSLLFMIPYLILWSLLFNKTSIQDIHSIERIGKVYSFVTGALEIIGAIASIITNSKYDIENHELYIKNHDYQSYIENQYMYRSLIVGSVIYLRENSWNKSGEQRTAWNLPGIPLQALHALHDSLHHLHRVS